MLRSVQTTNERRHQRLLKYGRDTNYALVCSSYKPGLRQDPKYQQWRRLVSRAGLRSMSPREKQILQLMLVQRMAYHTYCNGPPS